jgi:hypothetical protein
MQQARVVELKRDDPPHPEHERSSRVIRLPRRAQTGSPYESDEQFAKDATLALTRLLEGRLIEIRSCSSYNSRTRRARGARRAGSNGAVVARDWSGDSKAQEFVLEHSGRLADLLDPANETEQGDADETEECELILQRRHSRVSPGLILR